MNIYLGAGINVGPVKLGVELNTLLDGLDGLRGLLNAEDGVKVPLGIGVEAVDDAGLVEVALALLGSVLAGDAPGAVRVLGLPGVAIGVDLHVHDT